MEIAPEDVLGTWTSDETGQPSLELDEDGGVHGTDGCNRIVTTYRIDGDRVVFERFASTKMACQGVDPWLGGVREASVDGDTMTVKNGSGAEIGTLQRSGA